MKKIILGSIHADYISMENAILRIINLAENKSGGFIVTPNVDHIVIAETDEKLGSAYANAALSLADGKPLIWISRLVGFPLPGKISGSDLVRPLLKQAARKGLRIFLLGSAPGVGMCAAQTLSSEIPNLNIVGIDAPPLGFDTNPDQERKTLEKMLTTNPDIVLVALGAPKQEILMNKWRQQGITQVMLGIGASLDFIAGNVKRSPRWMSDMGLEWLYRLSKDPKRLAKRYLIRDMRIIPIFYRMMKIPKTELVVEYE